MIDLIIPSRQHVKAEPEVLAQAARRLKELNGMSDEDLASQIGKPVEWLKKLLEENPEKAI